jgi:drug/metabolite transporter (DMT)-like permease
MVWMVLCVLAGAGFGHIMRHAQGQQHNITWVGAWNYLFAAAACWVWLGLQRGVGVSWDAVLWGGISGLSFALAFFLLDHAIRAAGVGVTQSVQWLGVALPVAASIVLWREIPTLTQGIGLALAFLSLPLLACGPSNAGAPRGRFRVLFLTGIFLLEGMVGLAMKVYSLRVAAGAELPFLCLMFTGAGVANAAAALRSARPRWRDMPHGLSMGASNVLCNFALLRALALLPGPIVFPSISAGSIAVTAVLGGLLWQEKYEGRSVAGLVLAAIALVAINV